ncbi:MAG: tetratricopeptide repeat protein [Alphaproteobacteria bacterium]|nr:tetratricopeptide repeat protein [Alphaproteobacteria bacterium]
MRVKFMFVGVALATLVVGGNAWADSLAQEWRGCGSGDARRSIPACTAIIQWSHGKPSAKELAQAYLYRGDGYADRGDNDKAIADYTAAIHRDATLANAFFGRGVLYCKAGDYKRAVADFDAAIRLDPTNADSWAWRSRAKGQLGDANGANADEAHAIQLDPSVIDNMSDDD